MCWINNMATPIVLKKPLKVYKVGTLTSLGSFRSLYQDFIYFKGKNIPIIKINPIFEREIHVVGSRSQPWLFDCFCIHKGYHSYLTEEKAKHMKREYNNIGIFEIPSGATIYVSYRYKEVVSTNIRYLGLLE